LRGRGAGNPYRLTIAAPRRHQHTGDLDILGDITIVGAGANTTIVDGIIDRVFDVGTTGPGD
jgi:hypothetical protein